jgi:ribosome biogenesis protein ENP2
MESDENDSVKEGGSDSEDDIVSKIRKERGLMVRDKKQNNNSSIRSGKVQKKKVEFRMGSEGGKMMNRNDGRKSFGARLKSEGRRGQHEGHKVSRTALGGMEMSFTPKSSKKNKNRR